MGVPKQINTVASITKKFTGDNDASSSKNVYHPLQIKNLNEIRVQRLIMVLERRFLHTNLKLLVT